MAAKGHTVSELKKQLADNDIKQVYLFWGEERFLMDTYLERIAGKVPDGGLPEFNRLTVTEAKNSIGEIMDFLETYPMMSEKKLLIMRDTGIFKNASEEVKEFWTKQLENIPEFAVIVFAESEIDKRGVIYKAVEKAGFVLEFAYLSPVDTVTWAERQILNAKKKIKKDNAEYLVEICGEGLGNLNNEVKKFIDFCEEEVTRSDIDRLVSKSINTKVFEMTDAIMEHNADKALGILSDMKTVKESAFKILYILFGTFDKMLQANLMQQDGESADVIAKKLKVPPFIARKYMKRSFREDFLTDCVVKIAEIDYAIKEGKTDEWTALETFVAELFNL